MKGFRQHVIDRQLDESLVRKGAVASYAAQGKRYGDQAVTSYGHARYELQRSTKAEVVDAKIDHMTSALLHVIDGLIATRNQIGAISAQVTSHSLLTGSSR
jgi:predicted HD phosphohydrolase